MTNVVYADNVRAYIASAVTTGATTIPLRTGEGAAFPTIPSGKHCPATIVNRAGAFENVSVTAVSGDNLTVVRARGATTAQEWGLGDELFISLPAHEIQALFENADELTSYASLATAVADDLSSDVGSLIQVDGAGGGLFQVKTGETADGFVTYDANAGLQQIERVVDPRGSLTITSAETAQVLVDGAAALTVDGATRRMGVGTSTPQFPLDVRVASGSCWAQVRTDANNQDTGIRFQQQTYEWQLYHATWGGLIVRDQTVGASRLVVRHTGGEVGIGGTPSSGNRLQVDTTATATALVVDDATGNTTITGDVRVNAGASNVDRSSIVGVAGTGRGRFRAVEDSDSATFIGAFFGYDSNGNRGVIGRHNSGGTDYGNDVNVITFARSENAIGLHSLPYSGAALSVGTTAVSQALVVDDATGYTEIAGRLGIGSQAPGYSLDIVNAGAQYLRVRTSDAAEIAGLFIQGSGQSWQVYKNSADNLILRDSTAGLNAIVCRQGGASVGIGTVLAFSQRTVSRLTPPEPPRRWSSTTRRASSRSAHDSASAFRLGRMPKGCNSGTTGHEWRT